MKPYVIAIFAAIALAIVGLNGCAERTSLFAFNFTPKLVHSNIGKDRYVKLSVKDKRNSNLIGTKDASVNPGDIFPHSLTDTITINTGKIIRAKGFKLTTTRSARRKLILEIKQLKTQLVQTTPYFLRPTRITQATVYVNAINGKRSYNHIYQVTSRVKLTVPETETGISTKLAKVLIKIFNQIGSNKQLWRFLGK